jgi:hypothetical protein
MADEQRMYQQQLGPILKACRLSMVGENVAYGYSNGREAVTAWMNSRATGPTSSTPSTG